MKNNISLTKYTSSNQEMLPTSDQEYRYPINSFLSQTVTSDDEFKVILLIKDDGQDFWKCNRDYFKNEMDAIVQNAGAKVEYVQIDSNFDQEKRTHEQLVFDIVDAIDEDSHIMIDMTYGPKDLVLILSTVLKFAETFLQCETDYIVYGLAKFDKNNKLIKGSTELCDMSILYFLNSVVDLIQADNSTEAKEKLKDMLLLN